MRLVFQPVWDLAEWRVGYCEALLRWEHPALGALSPGEFIPLAEASGEIDALGHWVLEQAAREAVRWPSMVSVSVNLSPAQLRAPGLPARVERVLRRTGLAPERLCLELTEGLMIADADEAASMLRRLRGRGIGLWLDDFGTGHASLAILRRLPFGKIKIDRGFIAPLGTDGHAEAVLAAILALARAFGLGVVAEGVETGAQLAILRRLGCGAVQGYLTGAPMEPAAIRALLAQGAAAPRADVVASAGARVIDFAAAAPWLRRSATQPGACG